MTRLGFQPTISHTRDQCSTDSAPGPGRQYGNLCEWNELVAGVFHPDNNFGHIRMSWGNVNSCQLYSAAPTVSRYPTEAYYPDTEPTDSATAPGMYVELFPRDLMQAI